MGGVAGSVGVALQLDWDVEFEGTDIVSSAVRKHTITPDAGYSNLFTTSDGSWNASVLTFKMHAGGAMVPFSAADPSVVYTVAQGTKVPYFDSSAKRQECKWFARIQDQPGLVLFSSREDALAYVRTGDVSKAITYYKEGDWVTPAVPKFEEVSVSQILHEVEEERLAAARQLVTLTSDENLARILRHLTMNLEQRPKGTSFDPVKVFVEDPVRGLLDEALGG